MIAAGGLSARADREWVAKNLNLAMKLTDGAKVYVPAFGENAGAPGSSEALVSGTININTGSASELDGLPGVGPVTAQKIIDNRPYSSVQDLLSKKAVNQKVFDNIKDKISVFYMGKYIKLWIGFLLILLAGRFFIYHNSSKSYVSGQSVSFAMTLLSEPTTSGSYQVINARLSGFSLVKIIAPPEPKFHYGDTVHVLGTISVPKRTQLSSSVIQLLENNKPNMTMYFPKIEADKKSGLAVIYLIRQKIISLFNDTLPADASALLIGIVFGIKGNMSRQFLNNIKVLGVMHVIAASGMNVSMVGEFISSFFTFFLKRQLTFMLTIFVILFYALIAGLDPSIVRASIMGIMTFSAQILGRQRLAGYSLFIAGYSMLFFEPYLVFDVGFQLSFLSTAGLLYIRPLLEQGDRAKLLRGSIIGDEIATTLSAQIATLPILLGSFGTYSYGLSRQTEYCCGRFPY